jgi:hypothetical protein
MACQLKKVSKYEEHRRPSLPHQISITQLQDLCNPHLLKVGHASINEAGNIALHRSRSDLKHDHRCRCATELMELATKLHKGLEMLRFQHEERCASLRRELSLCRLVQVEWDSHFGSNRLTPSQVHRELSSLRQRVADLEEEQRKRRELEAAHLHQVDMLYQILEQHVGSQSRNSMEQ